MGRVAVVPVELRGLAAALCQTEDFQDADPTAVEELLAEAGDEVRVRFANEGVGTPFVRSGEPFTHLLLVQSGVLVPWQHPHSELRRPFLIGVHELLMSSDRWVATYSALTESTIIEIPRSSVRRLTEALPQVQARMLDLILHRISRFYWTSLSTTGSPRARVAAALVSRLALHGEDFGTERPIEVKQTDLVRLTVLSRTAVASALRALEADGLVLSEGRSPRYFSGSVLIPDVDALKDAAFSDVRSVVVDRFEPHQDQR